jgi:hypothetical protein
MHVGVHCLAILYPMPILEKVMAALGFQKLLDLLREVQATTGKRSLHTALNAKLLQPVLSRTHADCCMRMG